VKRYRGGEKDARSRDSGPLECLTLSRIWPATGPVEDPIFGSCGCARIGRQLPSNSSLAGTARRPREADDPAECRVGRGAGVLALAPGVAHAGGSPFYPGLDRYEPGDQVTFVGYTGGGQLGWIEDGPFYGYLALEPGTAAPAYYNGGAAGPFLRSGPMELHETGRGGWLSLRLAVTFTLPDDLQPGVYSVGYCNDPCTTGLGDLTDGVVAVGVALKVAPVRGWPADDPALVGAPASVAPPGATLAEASPTMAPAPQASLPAPSDPDAGSATSSAPEPPTAVETRWSATPTMLLVLFDLACVALIILLAHRRRIRAAVEDLQQADPPDRHDTEPVLVKSP
jgi:hypothetical protein